MRSTITKEYLDSLRQALIDAEEKLPRQDEDYIEARRREYRMACAIGYSTGVLVFKDGQ